MDHELDARLTAIEKALQVLGREVRDVATQMRWYNENAKFGQRMVEGLMKDATAMAHLREMALPGTSTASMPVPSVEPLTEEGLAKLVADLPPVPTNLSACCGGSFPRAQRTNPDGSVPLPPGALSPDEIKDILKQHSEN